MTVHAANPKNIVEYQYWPTVGRKMAAMVVETAWLMTKAILIPFERMRVGINSERASQTHTPGPIAKNAMKMNSVIATVHPWLAGGTGVISAFSIFSGAVRAASSFPNGFEKNAFTPFAGTQSSRLISMGLAAGSSDRTARLAARKSP